MDKGFLKRLSLVLGGIILPYPVGLLISHEHEIQFIWLIGFVAIIATFFTLMIIIGIVSWIIDGY